MKKYLLGLVVLSIIITPIFASAVTTYTINAIANGGGVITSAKLAGGLTTYNQDETPTFVFVPNSDSRIKSITIDGTNYSSAPALASFTKGMIPATKANCDVVSGCKVVFKPLSSSHTINVIFEPIPTYTITATAGEGGTFYKNGIIYPNGTTVLKITDEPQDYDVVPDQAHLYTLSDVLLDGVSEASLGNLKYQYAISYSGTPNRTIEAKFVKKLATNMAIKFTAKPLATVIGSTGALHFEWSSENAGTCTYQVVDGAGRAWGVWNGALPTTGATTTKVSSLANQTYKVSITCYDSKTTASVTVTEGTASLTIITPPIVKFTSPTAMSGSETLDFKWQSQGADKCSYQVYDVGGGVRTKTGTDLSLPATGEKKGVWVGFCKNCDFRVAITCSNSSGGTTVDSHVNSGNNSVVVPPVSACPGVPGCPIDPKNTKSNVGGVIISNLVGGQSIAEGLAVGFDYANFLTDITVMGGVTANVSRVSLQLCNIALNKTCQVFPGNSPQNLTQGTYFLPINLKSGKWLNVSGLTSFNVDNLKKFYGKIVTLKICPIAVQKNSATLWPLASSLATCGESKPFKIADPNDGCSDPNSTCNVPSGQGCMEGECVCVGGVAKKCGMPMQPGTGCPKTSYCSAGPSASLSGRMIASVGSLFSSVINWFR